MLVDPGEASGAGVISVGTLQQLLYGADALHKSNTILHAHEGKFKRQLLFSSQRPKDSKLSGWETFKYKIIFRLCVLIILATNASTK